jgi:PIN domain nuclease of toxin-antitoxin system
MKFLLDTHVFLWYLLGDPRLINEARQIIDAKTGLYFSIVSLWEISIKLNVGKLEINRPVQELFQEVMMIDAEILPITVEDTQAYASLPVIPGHRDPFDRILVTQAMNRSLLLVSADTKFNPYAIQRIWS